MRYTASNCNDSIHDLQDFMKTKLVLEDYAERPLISVVQKTSICQNLIDFIFSDWNVIVEVHFGSFKFTDNKQN